MRLNMKGWKIILPVVILGVILFFVWQEQREKSMIGNLLESVSDIDSVIIKDGKTSKKILTLTNSEPVFSELVNIYDAPYHDLKWSERKLLKNDPAYEAEFLINDDVQYTMNIYKVEEDQISLIPNDFTAEVRSYSYIYSPDGDNTYIFARKEIHQLLGVNEGFKKLLNMIISK
jgi:hypothetical protein